jgi:hypothetical protein
MWRGAVAQLVEHLNGIQKVGGSIPPGSTMLKKGFWGGEALAATVLNSKQNYAYKSIILFDSVARLAIYF